MCTQSMLYLPVIVAAEGRPSTTCRTSPAALKSALCEKLGTDCASRERQRPIS